MPMLFHSYPLDIERVKEILLAVALIAGFFMLLVKVTLHDAAGLFHDVAKLWRKTVKPRRNAGGERRPSVEVELPETDARSNVAGICRPDHSDALCRMLDSVAFEYLRRAKPNEMIPLLELNNIWAMKLSLTEEASSDHCAYLSEALRLIGNDLAVRVFLADERRRRFCRFSVSGLNPCHGRLLLCIAGKERDVRPAFRRILETEDEWIEIL